MAEHPAAELFRRPTTGHSRSCRIGPTRAGSRRTAAVLHQRNYSWTHRETLVSQRVTMYTTPWCGYCRRLKSQLAREGIEVAEVDIERDPAAADYVMSVNGGMQTVPTVVFPDGTALTNPSAAQVRERLTTLAIGT
jgi:mycoredoxin